MSGSQDYALYCLEELTLKMPLKNPIHFHPIIFPYLKRLRIFTRKIEDFPPSLFYLTHLEELSIIGPIPTTFTEHFFFPKLKILRLNRSCNSKRTQFIHFSRNTYFPRLEILDLGENQMDRLPHWIFQLENLHTLILKKNLFSEIPSGLHKLSTLTRIILDDNRIFDYCPTHLPSQLQHLSLDNNPVAMKNIPFSVNVIGKGSSDKV